MRFHFAATATDGGRFIGACPHGCRHTGASVGKARLGFRHLLEHKAGKQNGGDFGDHDGAALDVGRGQNLTRHAHAFIAVQVNDLFERARLTGRLVLSRVSEELALHFVVVSTRNRERTIAAELLKTLFEIALTRDDVRNETGIDFEVGGDSVHRLEGLDVFLALLPVTTVCRVVTENSPNVLVDDLHFEVVLDVQRFLAEPKKLRAERISVLGGLLHEGSTARLCCICKRL